MAEKNPNERAVKVRGARVHNLKNIDIDIPLGKLVAVAGVSGSGKSSLALGVLYAEGSRRYLEALSAYTRRRLTQAAEAKVDSVENIPAAIALHQRPAIPGVRSTFGTATELANSLRLMFSRLGSHLCPKGHYMEPSVDTARGRTLVCSKCGARREGPSAESFSFNSSGACRRCGGTGIVRTVDESTLVPDESLTIDQGAVAPWNSLMWSLMTDICRAMGVRTDVPFSELTAAERDIVFHGPAVKKHIFYKSKNGNEAGELDFTYYNAVYTVENALAKVKDEKGMKRVDKFLAQAVCPDCCGTRLNAEARSTLLCGKSLPEVLAMPLDELAEWVKGVPSELPFDIREMAESIVAQFTRAARRLLELGLGYLTLDRAGSTLSTGERQRVQLARALKNQTTGVLYVLDEPSIGLHPANVDGLLGVIEDLVAGGNSVLLVDHDVRVLKAADHLIELGPGAGAKGGSVLCCGTPSVVASAEKSLIGGFLKGKGQIRTRPAIAENCVFAGGELAMSVGCIHTLKDVELKLPKGRLTVVTGVSGSGKTTLILESLVPALKARCEDKELPAYVRSLSADGIRRVNMIDAAPVGINIRSTVATYSGVLDDLRRLFAQAPEARALGLRAGDFSYNTGSLRCPCCDGTGQITLDIQFLPDMSVPCPDCGGSRYGKDAWNIHYYREKIPGASTGFSLPYLMSQTVDEALELLSGEKKVCEHLEVLSGLGLGYLTLGEATPSLSGGEAQRLKIAFEMGKSQEDAVFVFDEPTIGLHPLDIRMLVDVFERLIRQGATVVVIEHDLDMIANADYIVDMGPGGGVNGGRIIATGTPIEIADNPESLTGQYLKKYLSGA